MKRGLALLVFGAILSGLGAYQLVYNSGQPLEGVNGTPNFQHTAAAEGAVLLVIGFFIMILGFMTWYHYHKPN